MNANRPGITTNKGLNSSLTTRITVSEHIWNYAEGARKYIGVLTSTNLSLPTWIAVCNGVSPASSLIVTSAPLSRSLSTIWYCFERMAVWRGVLPDLSWRLISLGYKKQQEHQLTFKLSQIILYLYPMKERVLMYVCPKIKRSVFFFFFFFGNALRKSNKNARCKLKDSWNLHVSNTRSLIEDKVSSMCN